MTWTGSKPLPTKRMWIEKTPNGKYKACERYIDPISGKTKKVAVVIDRDTKAARNAAYEALRGKIAQRVSVTASSTVTLGELAEKYLAHQKGVLKAGSYVQSVSHIDSILRSLSGDAIVDKLTARYVSERLSMGNSTKAQANRDIAYLKAMIRWGYRHDYVASKEWLDKIEPLKVKRDATKIEAKYLEPQELAALLDSMGSERWRLLTEFLALTGMRIGEVIVLLDSDVTDTISVTKTYSRYDSEQNSPKTDASVRDIHIQPELERCIRAIRTWRLKVKMRTGAEIKLFFPDYDGGMLNYVVYKEYLRRHSAKIGHTITPHALRHTHVSILAERGVPLDVISRRLGHAGSNITRDVYLHVTAKRKEQDAAYIDSVQFL